MEETTAMEKTDEVLAILKEALVEEAKLIEEDRFCEWYLGKLAEANALEAKVKKQFDRIMQEIAARRKALQYVKGPEFRQRVDMMLTAGPRKKDGTLRKKSVNFLTGTAGYRSSRESIEIKELEKAKRWAFENLDIAAFGAAIGKINKTGKLVELIKEHNLYDAIETLNKTPFLEHVKDCGEIPPGTEIHHAENRFYPQVENMTIPALAPSPLLPKGKNDEPSGIDSEITSAVSR